MTNPVLDFIEEHADEIAALGPENEKLGKLTPRAAEILRQSGVIKMLQSAKYGGSEAHPAEFAKTVMRIASLDGSSGWVSGIVGVHPWEMSMMPAQLQEEIWGEDHDTWIASPYAPMGVLRPVEGGYIFNGRWQFSSGTDHCDWIFLGAFLGDEDGKTIMPPKNYHVVLPRSDYEIVEDSWDVVGLRGTGSKDVIVKDAFIPEYRVVEFGRFLNGSQLADSGQTDPCFGIPFTTAFPLGITSAVIGIAEGALNAHLAYQKTRVQITGTKVKDDPYVLFAISAAAEEIKASRTAILDNVTFFYDKAKRGEEVTFEERAASRRTQVAAAWRAVRAMDEVVARSGGNGMRMDNPIQRFWRDGHMGLAHAIHVPGSVFHAAALLDIDVTPPPGPMLSMI
ncbi:alkylation response protein AidB-like acyl-CoA dehydrogenase [Nocardioides daedukensis]|uniref:Alkylation response protein AidB-like acyl-CoA dehydrogenase n=1 Tax=Nocardioides daedukensis TaxID=634462 RepID=A0A7Y9S4K9_9ACTN|nr:acyl-CoA dehydrogenase family protein [Nocardioides daedukensis]NYG59913.1 alkylation response protein AidB-like acyl-CoA dehydrogenase [Nocardioides daedukensis]